MAKDTHPGQIASNPKAYHSYEIETKFEAGIVLEGWEVKSLREGRVQIRDSHVIVRKGELWLLNAHITALLTASTHISPNPTRSRKLLMHKREIASLIGKVEQKGYTLIPLALYWKGPNVKVSLGLARGKKLHDKRAAEKEKDFKRQAAQLLKQSNRGG